MESAEPVPEVPGWQVRRGLGRGGSSTVWLVADDGGAEAALKVPDRRAEAPTELLDVELRAVGELTHDHVVRPLGVVQTDRGPGLLSEYHAGGSLGALVRASGPLPVSQVVTVLVPVAQALQALHDHGVVHGDLSPGNILFTLQGRPAVSDLGSSRLLGGPASRTGTPGFCAPELDGPVDGPGASAAGGAVRDPARPDRPADAGAAAGLAPAADIYSLAAVGWYALTGRAPARTTSRAPLSLVVPDIPADVVELLEAGLDEDPARRPDAERFAVACYRWATPEPVDLYPSATPEVAMELPTRRRAAPPRRPRRRPVLLAGTIGLALAAAAALVVWGPGRAPDETGARGETPNTTTSAPARGPVPEGTSPAASADGDSSPSGTTPSAVPGPETEEVTAAAASLGAARARALTSLEQRDVEAYSLRDSPAQDGDLRLLEELRTRGLRYEGLRLETTVTGPVERTGSETATVPLALTISPYRTVSTDGDVVAETETATTERLVAEMERTAGGWRVREIQPAPAGQATG